MDGKNSIGRRISLLNDNEGRTSGRLPSVAPSLHSRTSSYTSVRSLSPPTPQLVRSDSADSGAMQTPSPITPSFSFEGLSVSHKPASPVFSAAASLYAAPAAKEAAPSMYPPNPQHPSSWIYPPYSAAPQPGLFRTSVSPPSADRQPSSSAPKLPAKKNQYPCPMAKQYNCTDYFTTSGHAARHAKKHTGKKDAICPECNKAFTRKDNMEQHRRTHQNGRNAPRTTGDSQAKKTKPQTKRPKPAPLEETELPVVDPCLPVSPVSSLGMPDGTLTSAMQAPHPYHQDTYTQRSSYPDPTSFMPQMLSLPAYNSMLQGSSTSGLDTLAIAAATTDGLKRKYSE